VNRVGQLLGGSLQWADLIYVITFRLLYISVLRFVTRPDLFRRTRIEHQAAVIVEATPRIIEGKPIDDLIPKEAGDLELEEAARPQIAQALRPAGLGVEPLDDAQLLFCCAARISSRAACVAFRSAMSPRMARSWLRRTVGTGQIDTAVRFRPFLPVPEAVTF